MRRVAKSVAWFAIGLGGVSVALHLVRVASALSPVQAGLALFAGLLIAGTVEKR